MADELDELVDELYALPLERFVPERDVLAKSLRSGGRREEAGRVAALTKPSIVAWAVNQLVRGQRPAADALWDAGDAVLDTQARVLAGEATGPELRQAIEAERSALARLSDAARGLMTGSGRFLGEQNVQAAAETLHAAAMDPQAREQVAAGRLARPLRLTGLQAIPTGSPPGSRARRVAEEPEPEVATRERMASRQEADAETEAARRKAGREERARRKAAEQALARAERDRDQARRRIADAVDARDAARNRMGDALEELNEAETRLALAEEKLAEEHARLEHAEDRVDAARRDAESA